MIIYFSGTGNTYDAARIIAAVTEDVLVDLGKNYKQGEFELSVTQGEDLGIIFPVYRWSTPRIVDEFFRKVSFKTDDGRVFRPGYCYAVDVYGYFTGSEVGYLNRLLNKEHGFTLDASFAIPSVANCIYVTNPPKPDKQEKQIRKEENEAYSVARQIKRREQVGMVKGNPCGRMLSKVTGTEQKARPIGQFSITQSKCTRCGFCISICPTNTIKMVGEQPRWGGDDCTECLACLHRCPMQAIEYGKISIGRRRYVNPILKERA